MDTLYAEEKFAEAERALTLGGGDIKERVHSAFMCFHPVSEKDLPEELRDDYKWIIDQLTRKPPLVSKCSDKIISGDVEQTLRLMRRKTAGKIAERICYIREQLREYNN